MSHLKVLCVLTVIGIWTSKGVRGEMPDTAKIVRKIVELGKVADLPNCAAAAIGRDTSWYDKNTRQIICRQMQTNCVIECVKNHMNHQSNKLSDEDPGETKVFAFTEDGQNKQNDRALVGFHCKARVNEGSKSFVVVSVQYSPSEIGYVAYVPREYVLER